MLLEERSDPSDAVGSINSLGIDAMTYGIGTRRVGLATTTTYVVGSTAVLLHRNRSTCGLLLHQRMLTQPVWASRDNMRLQEVVESMKDGCEASIG